MKHQFIIIGLALSVVVSCKHVNNVPRETIGLVQSIVEDTTGVWDMVVRAGSGVDGAIALLGEPEDVLALARQFRTADRVDNVDARPKPDSLPDFAGETFHALMDVYHEPYSQFLGSQEGLDSLREVAVVGALHAWDTLCYHSPADRKPQLKKKSAKVLIYTSSLQKEYGLFDVDTLLQLAGGKCRVLSPVNLLLDDALASDAKIILVWAPDAIRESRVWEMAAENRNRPGVTVSVFSPKPALDIRTQLRDVLRQYMVSGSPLDALIIDRYGVDLSPIQSELDLISLGGTEEDAALNELMSARFHIYDPADVLIKATYNLLREENLFSHKIAKPVVKYYESEESESGQVVLVETSASYVNSTYVSSLN